ncbi:MAG: YcgL domain-containing protein [Gammaproteobacteria bacterium]|jgi:uncharacterized protein YcgL (UPF0745 family)|nr:YcgL domain-containing protein [Gammaproteobacteria bacterium]MBK8992508.1 YcgL domain-containing protein [Gammaproteobacteria bacterium]MBK9468041.1 YcgL domain-containing protein [Gammaproteobacteria bacterium]MBP6482067.1 YcgL domain-containing protein [Pseudomonadales bacterium]MBP7911323.1 YcgL domain-containing protein [Pseudomonadales bacterium]
MKSICAVYRSRRNPDTYLYVDHHEGLSRVPEALQRELGGTERAMTLVLTPQRRLARTSAAEVLRAIREQGYYLQMPPLPETLRVQGRDAT